MKGAACKKWCVVRGLLLLLVPQPGNLLSSLSQADLDGADPKLPWMAQAHVITVHVIWCLDLNESCTSIHLQPGALLSATSHPSPAQALESYQEDRRT